MHAWLVAKRQTPNAKRQTPNAKRQTPNAKRRALAKADTIAKAIDYSLSNWMALMCFLDTADMPIDNNAAENSIRPLSVGRKSWLFVGSQQAGERAAYILGLIESAELKGHDPWACLKDVVERLSTLRNRDLARLLPHNWHASTGAMPPIITAAAVVP